MEKLNIKQQAFVLEYLKDLNATQAAIRAGYSAASAFVQGSRLLSNDKVRAAIERANERRMQKIEIDADFVLGGIKRLIARCEQAEPVLDKDGNPIGEYTFKASEAMKGYELLGKHKKLWTDKVEVDIPSVSVRDFTGRSDG